MQTNTQKPDLVLRDPNGDLEVHHAFFTIQGEGPFVGRRAVFLRLSGCNLQCPFCDTDYTSQRVRIAASDLPALIHASIPKDTRGNGMGSDRGFPLVVISGGEPFRQNLLPGIDRLIEAGFDVQIETNGTLWLPGFRDEATIVCSPKTGSINPHLAARANAFKYVLQYGEVNPADGLPTSTLGQKNQTSVARPPVGSKAIVYVQPLDQADGMLNRLNAETAVQSCMKFGYRLCLQTHKLVNLE